MKFVPLDKGALPRPQNYFEQKYYSIYSVCETYVPDSILFFSSELLYRNNILLRITQNSIRRSRCMTIWRSRCMRISQNSIWRSRRVWYEPWGGKRIKNLYHVDSFRPPRKDNDLFKVKSFITTTSRSCQRLVQSKVVHYNFTELSSPVIAPSEAVQSRHRSFRKVKDGQSMWSPNENQYTIEEECVQILTIDSWKYYYRGRYKSKVVHYNFTELSSPVIVLSET